ncbi:pectinesterase family protein [Streptacidiphilus rugosus]|uniref:pectinesterase family protein n=1 Tax=Streptacidiphilus rugosus TaxID=405783 RepID=UPI0009FC625F|nr:pectinesterase family protein [Streptacidiphilus rugosus]
MSPTPPLPTHRRSRLARRVPAVVAAVAIAGGGLAAIPLLASASSTSDAATHGTHGTHGARSARTLTVAAGGGAQFRTVQAAVDAAAAGDTIVVAKGTYHETVSVPATRTGLSLVGATGNPADVVITYGNAAGLSRPDGSPYGTMGSATATFAAAGMTVKNLTIVNSFSKASHPGVKGGQAVALNAEGDRQVYLNDRFLGHQDTLLAWSPTPTAQTRQYFRSVLVSGDVDFLFGNATAVFDHATIDALDDGAPADGLNGFLTAANTEASRAYGFLITDSTVTSSAKARTYYLGRPWHPTSTAVAQVVVRNTVLPAAVKGATPWTAMGGYPWQSARFDSYANTGTGAKLSAANGGVSANSPQLSAARAAKYTARTYLAGTDGWNPTSVGATTSGTTTAPVGSATGDARKVSEPVVPATVCATVPAQLAMPGRTAGSAAESSPPDTARLQRALDACTQSGSATVAVRLSAADAAHNAFLSGPLTVHRGEVLLLDSGVTLFASRNPVNYQVSGKPTCGTLSSHEGGCKPLITVAGADAGIESVRAASGAQGRIDGRGDQTILGGGTTWWGLATAAQKAGENQNNPRLIQAVDSDNFTLYHLDMLNSPNFHVVYQGGTGFTAWGVRIKTPDTARNTDGIDPGGATNVTVNDSYIMTGDDGIAVKGGAATRDITVENSHFYGTHGISIGSETNGGVSNVLVRNNTVTGVDSLGNVSGSSTGIRIKSSPANGGTVSDVTYLNTCVTAVRAPMVFDTHYSNGSGSGVPFFTRIIVDGFRATASQSGAKSTFVGLNASHPLGLALWNVSVDATADTAAYAAITRYADNLVPAGTGVGVTSVNGTPDTFSCSFPAYPAL